VRLLSCSWSESKILFAYENRHISGIICVGDGYVHISHIAQPFMLTPLSRS
jgi:hypothetical protein